jgi:L-seryl-tRNA(Ser) seleniumtransferase
LIQLAEKAYSALVFKGFMNSSDNHNSLLRSLPSVDALLKSETARRLADEIGALALTSLARQANEALRQELLRTSIAENGHADRAELLRQAEELLLQLHQVQISGGIRRVINATGVILHTNLGRAPLSPAARDALQEASGYCTLEYDTVTGTRGRRSARAEELLIQLTEAEAALIVNNCAAAALLVLNTFSREAETIVSRGELVEIGGDFRVPDVMSQSEVRMIEVGTTNRTGLSDYRNAINDQTRMIMRVHTSNYRIIGFTRTTSLTELGELAHNAGLLLYEDAGSGALFDLTGFGIDGEPIIKQSLKDGADIVSFSGDKLLGGPQAGLIVGRAGLIERMRRNPLYRALRADKLRLMALEATLGEYSRGSMPPTLEMIAMPFDQIARRANEFVRKINEKGFGTLRVEAIESESAVGGGSAPTSSLPTIAIAIAGESLTPNQIADNLRQWNPPIIARIADDRVLIDLRTVAPAEEIEIEKALCSVAASQTA